MKGEYWARGEWNAQCDQCGELFKSSKLLLQWDFLRVCRRCLDPRHPQELLKAPRPEAPIPWSRPESGSGCEAVQPSSPRVRDSVVRDKISRD